MQTPKKIEIFLLEGTPYGLRYIDMVGWIGRMFIAPRPSIKELLKREEFLKPGVYFLIGKTPDSDILNVYIGEADELRSRIAGHNAEDFWTDCVAFMSKDDFLNKGSVRYIESQCIEKANRDKQANLENKTKPPLAFLSEADSTTTNEFIDNLVYILAVSGYKIIRYYSPENFENEVLLYCNGPDAKAKGKETDEGFIVYKGSLTRVKETPTWEIGGVNLRKKLLENGVLQGVKNNSRSYIFSQDYVFTSPSAASGIVLARSANGRLDWKDGGGRTLKDLQKNS